MEHVRTYASRMNASKMIRACEAGRHWPEAVFLYMASEDFDTAVRVMIVSSSSSSGWDCRHRSCPLVVPPPHLTPYPKLSPSSLDPLPAAGSLTRVLQARDVPGGRAQGPQR